MQTCRHADIQTYRHTDIQTYRHTNIHTYIHACMHTCIHTYIHTYITSHHITSHYITSHYIKLRYLTLTLTLTLTYMHACMHACKHTYVHVYIYNYIYVRYIWYTNHIDSFFPWSFKALCHRMHQCPMASMASLNKFHLFIPETPVKVPFFHIFQFKLYHHLSTVFFVSSKIDVNNLVQGAEGSGRGGSFAFACHSHPPSLHLAVPWYLHCCKGNRSSCILPAGAASLGDVSRPE